METSPGEKGVIDVAGLNALHEDAVRYRRLRSIATCTSLPRDGTGYWSIPAHLLAYPARSCDEAVDTALSDAA